MLIIIILLLILLLVIRRVETWIIHNQYPEKLIVWTRMFLNEILEKDDKLDESLGRLQDGGAPIHLDRYFPGRGTSWRGPINWPARSHNLTPNKFFLWEHLKSMFYETKPEMFKDLRQQCAQKSEFNSIEIFASVRRAIIDTIHNCQCQNTKFNKTFNDIFWKRIMRFCLFAVWKSRSKELSYDISHNL